MNILDLKRLYYRFKYRHSQADSLPLEETWKSTHDLYSQPFSQTNLMVIDCEASSLNPARGELLSIGWVMIQQGAIRFETAEQHFFSPKESVGQSAVIHQLRDCDLTSGVDAEDIIDQLIDHMHRSVLVFHHAKLDIGYINLLSRSRFGLPLLMPIIDTLRVEKAIMERKHQELKPDDLSLGNCRERYNLPVYRGHDALTDALATAELLLAQVAHKRDDVRIKSLLSN